MALLKEELNEALRAALAHVTNGSGVAASISPERVVFGPTRSPEHGDLATSAAMAVAKPLGRNPLEIAEALASRLREHPLIGSAEVAKPGFVNLRLSPRAIAHVINSIQKQGAAYGQCAWGGGQSVLLEFVSANPTGPMHIGHCRHAATGDVLARVLSASGHKVTREFYINDAGVQFLALGRSFRYRCFEALGLVQPGEVTEQDGKVFFQGDAVPYPGEYLRDFAVDFVANKCKEELVGLPIERFATEARNRNMEMIERDLAALGVYFDHYVSEKALHEKGAVEKTLAQLRAAGNVYEKDGALWLKTQDFGDNEDRVLVKGDGSYTYLVPDIAYHFDKYLRGFNRYINIFGADHSGYPPRLRAGIAGLGEDEKKLSILLLRLVFLTKEGRRVKFSKRAGNFVALADVVEEAGSDATRWFMLQRSMDSEFEFDMDLATQHTSQNPVFKVQYAHARICSVARKAVEQGFVPLGDADAAAVLLTAPIEREMALYLAQYTEIVERSARELDVHHIPAYLLGLADLWNRYWSMAKTDETFRILRADDRGLSGARLLLADCIRQTLANALDLMGISAPEQMTRDEEED